MIIVLPTFELYVNHIICTMFLLLVLFPFSMFLKIICVDTYCSKEFIFLPIQNEFIHFPADKHLLVPMFFSFT